MSKSKVIVLPKELQETLIRIAGAWPAENAELARKDPIKFLSIFLAAVEHQVVDLKETGTYIGKILDECTPWIIERRAEMAARKKRAPLNASTSDPAFSCGVVFFSNLPRHPP